MTTPSTPKTNPVHQSIFHTPLKLETSRIKTFYDKFGRKQDWQQIYEGRALKALLEKGEFHSAKAVFEFGAGTGHLAETLLSEFLPSTACYVLVDVSDTMIRLTRQRLKKFQDRVTVLQTKGEVTFPFTDGSFDRFVSTYVLDLLLEEKIRALLQEAWRLLTPRGLLCVVNLTHGQSEFSRLLEKAWVAVHRKNPYLLGGCRPISLEEFLKTAPWEIRFHQIFCQWGLCSEVTIASRLEVPETSMDNVS